MTATRGNGIGDEMRAGLARTREYWERRARSEMPDLEKLEWMHRRTQQIRFAAFLADHDLQGTSVLDVGCGLADLHAYLRGLGLDAEYAGYDISASMIAQCRARYPEVHFACGDFLEYDPPGRFDYTAAFGIHNIRVPGGRAILEAVTRRQFALARIAAHVNLLTDRCGSFAPHIQAWRVEEVLAMALEITPYVALRHDFLHTDFSITLYREPAARTQADPTLLRRILAAPDDIQAAAP